MFKILKCFNPLYTIDSQMCTLANIEDPDEMLHYAAFHQDLHCLLRLKQSSEKEIQFHLETSRCMQWTNQSLLYEPRRKNSLD